MAIVTNILSAADSTTNLSDALMAAAGWWERMDPSQRKEYIKKHPRSKYAKDAIAEQPAPKKENAPAPVSPPIDDKQAKINKMYERDRRRREKLAEEARKPNAPGYRVPVNSTDSLLVKVDKHVRNLRSQFTNEEGSDPREVRLEINRFLNHPDFDDKDKSGEKLNISPEEMAEKFVKWREQTKR